LDDFHLIESNEVIQIVDFLIQNSPKKFHIAISTRTDPSLPLARLRSQNDLVEIRSTDLNFSANEISIFFNKKLKLDLTTEEINLLQRKTEGWIAGLQLTALSMQGRKDLPAFIRTLAGNNRYIMDYLIEEVLNNQDHEMEKFLLNTSILEKLSAPLCNVLLKEKDSQEKLRYLEKNNMFIVSLDDERIWYRYHHLFAEILQKRLNILKANEIPELHKRACKWYEQNNQKEEAVEHALLAKDYEQAAHLIGGFAKKVLDYGFDTQMLRWFRSLPDEFVYKDPNLTFALGGMLFQKGNYDEAEKHFLIVEELVETVPYDERRVLKGKVFVIRAFISMYLEDTNNILSHASKAIELLPETSFLWRASAIINLGYANLFLGNYSEAIQKFDEAVDIGIKFNNIFVIIVAKVGVAKIYKQQGNFEDAIKTFKEMYDVAYSKGALDTPMTGWIYNRWGEILIEQNKLNEALEKIQVGKRLSIEGSDASMIGESHMLFAKLHFANGDFENAEKEIGNIDKFNTTSDLPLFVILSLDDLKIRLWIEQGNFDSIEQWLKTSTLKYDEEFSFRQESKVLILSRIYNAQRKEDEALNLLKPYLLKAEEKGRFTRFIEMLLIKAIALNQKGNTSEALSCLCKAIDIAEPKGYFRIFLDEGEKIGELLKECIQKNLNTQKPYIKNLLFEFKKNQSRQSNTILLDALSNREMDVLLLLAKDLSNQDIASELFISKTTVKTHVRNILLKIEAKNRNEAVSKAKEKGIII